MEKNQPRILIADDHTLVAEAYRKLLEPECVVLGTVSDGRALVRTASELSPDLIIVDVSMPLLNGLDAVRQLRNVLPGIKIVFVTMIDDIDLAAEAFLLGASGFLLKSCAASELIIAVREALQGKRYWSPMVTTNTANLIQHAKSKVRGEAHRLTERQREVLQLLAEGKCMKEVGAVLNLTTRTIAFHKYRIMKVVNARSNAELVQYAIRNHLISG